MALASATERAYEAIRHLKAGTWEAVETMSVLVASCPNHPDARSVVESATTTAGAGDWDMGQRLSTVVARESQRRTSLTHADASWLVLWREVLSLRHFAQNDAG